MYVINEFQCILAHAVHLKEEEYALLAGKGVSIAHCPASNTRLQSGLCPLRKLMENGVTCGLGTGKIQFYYLSHIYFSVLSSMWHIRSPSLSISFSLGFTTSTRFFFLAFTVSPSDVLMYTLSLVGFYRGNRIKQHNKIKDLVSLGLLFLFLSFLFLSWNSSV